MNKGLILTLALVLGGGVVWLLLRDGGPASSARSATSGAGAAAASPDGASSALQAPPSDSAQVERDAAASANADASSRAAERSAAQQVVQPPQLLVQVPLTASLEEGKNLDRSFADRYAKIDTAGRLAKLDELVQLLEQFHQGTLPKDTKLDDSQVSDMKAEIDWLSANPGG